MAPLTGMVFGHRGHDLGRLLGLEGAQDAFAGVFLDEHECVGGTGRFDRVEHVGCRFGVELRHECGESRGVETMHRASRRGQLDIVSPLGGEMQVGPRHCMFG